MIPGWRRNRATDSEPASTPWLQSMAQEYSPAFSPDGRWLAYASNESGRLQVYVRRYPDGEALPVSVAGGNGPVWRRDGKEIFFQGPDGGRPKMMAVSVTPDGTLLRLGTPVALFDMQVTTPSGEGEQYQGSGNGGVGFDVLPDGRFVMIREPSQSRTANEIVLVRNWLNELKRLAPSK